MALDKVSAAMMSPLSVSETAPSNPSVGQRWYRASTAVTYQYTNDGTSSFWLDVSSSGIGTSADRGVDFVGDTDPIATTNGSGLAVGSVYYNRENNRHFVCTDASNNANVWSGRFTSTGGTITNYTGYRVHTFLNSGTFIVDGYGITSVDYLVVAGGGGGGSMGAGGAGGFRTAASLSVSSGSYTVTVGAGGAGVNGRGLNGGNSVFSSITSTGGGGGGGFSNSVQVGSAGGSGGGGGAASSAPYTLGAGGAGNTPSTSPAQGFAGGPGFTGANAGGGGGGATAVGGTPTSGVGGAGGAGEDQVMGLSAADSYTLLTNASAGHVVSGARYFAGGGGGTGSGTKGLGGNGGGGAGRQGGNAPIAGTGGTGGGGGAGYTDAGGAGGSGIVIIRFAV